MHNESHQAKTNLVVNWHVTEACNYRCAYCYAHWDRPEGNEIIRNPVATEELIRFIHQGFAQGGARVRLNFAGGEPLLFTKQVVNAMRLAAELGFEVSLITNGSRLTTSTLSAMAPLLKVLGISLDADTKAANLEIGRADSRGKCSPVSSLAEMVALARALNPSLIVKINTVVNAVNWGMDLSGLLERLAPQQWKVLKMLPSTTRKLEVTEEQFAFFVQQHARFRSVMRVEDNDAMVNSYVMVDPHGRFFQNGQQQLGYAYSPPILDVGAAEALRTITWSAEKFNARYATPSEVAK